MTKRLSILLSVIFPFATGAPARAQPSPEAPAPAAIPATPGTPANPANPATPVTPPAPPAPTPPSPAPKPAIAPSPGDSPAPQAEPERAPVAGFTPPKPPDPARYEKLADPSSFTVRLSAVEPVAEDPFPELSLVGYMVLGGKMNAWVQAADAEDPVQLIEGERDTDSGILLVAVKGAEDMFTAEAEIEANGKKGTLQFTDAGMSVTPGAGAAKPAAKTAQTNPGQPGQPPQQGQPGQPNPGQPGQHQGQQPSHTVGSHGQPGFAKPGTSSGQISPKPPTGPGSSGPKSAPSTITPRRRIILPN